MGKINVGDLLPAVAVTPKMSFFSPFSTVIDCRYGANAVIITGRHSKKHFGIFGGSLFRLWRRVDPYWENRHSRMQEGLLLFMISPLESEMNSLAKPSGK